MSYSCVQCKKYNYRPVCKGCKHRCCKDSEVHTKHKKKDLSYSSSDSSSSGSEDSRSGGEHHDYNKCGKGCREKKCGDKCRVFRRIKKKKRLKFVKVKRCKSRRSKKPLDQSFTARDIVVIKEDGDIRQNQNLQQLKLCDEKTTIGALKHREGDCYSIDMCGSRAKCADVSFNFSTGFERREKCGDVIFELTVQAIRRDCHDQKVDKFCEGNERVFVKSACRDGKYNVYTLTWKNITLGKDRTVFKFCRRPLDCEDEYYGLKDYDGDLFIENVCVYSERNKH